MTYKEKHFIECTYNPLTTGAILELYPDLRQIVLPAWETDNNLDSIIRYMIIVYDPKSPLYKKEKDFHKRQNVAAELSQFTDEDALRLVMSGTHGYFGRLLVSFLKDVVKSREWAIQVSVEFCFWENIFKLNQPVQGEDSKKELEALQKKALIKDELEKDNERLYKLQTEFFGGDETIVEKVKSRKSVEDYALEAQKN